MNYEKMWKELYGYLLEEQNSHSDSEPSPYDDTNQCAIDTLDSVQRKMNELEVTYKCPKN